jgi:RNA polymerase sigma-70 factor, ECF subfamily
VDELDLIRRMLRGEQRAFDEFFDAFAVRLGAFAARRSSLDPAAIEDVVQTTMINAMRSLGSFGGRSSLFTWLCQICRNQLADVRRKAARQPALQSLDQLTADRTSATIIALTEFRDPLEECTADSTRSAVRQLINGLPAHYARILELRFGDELAVAEIADLLQVSESAAESQLVRARQAFKIAWSNATAAATRAATVTRHGEAT